MLKEHKHPGALEILSRMPDFVWPLVAVVIGGMLTWIPLHWQLEHDSREREKERQMSVRRDVYLRAAEEIGEQLGYLANFASAGEPAPQGYWEAINRILVIGGNETVAAVNRLNDYMHEAFAELGPQMFEVGLLERRFEVLSKIADRTGEERRICIEQMKEYNLSGIKDEQKWSVIEAESASAERRSEHLGKELRNTGNEIMKLTRELIPKCVRKAQEADELVLPVIVAIRKELDAPFDEKAYRAMMKASHNKSKANVEKSIASMKDKYDRAMQAIDQENVYDEE